MKHLKSFYINESLSDSDLAKLKEIFRLMPFNTGRAYSKMLDLMRDQIGDEEIKKMFTEFKDRFSKAESMSNLWDSDYIDLSNEYFKSNGFDPVSILELSDSIIKGVDIGHILDIILLNENTLNVEDYNEILDILYK